MKIKWNKKTIEGIFLFVLGALLVISASDVLIKLASGESIQYTSYRYGTLSGGAAISTTIGAFVGGLIFVVLGIFAIKKGNNESA